MRKLLLDKDSGDNRLVAHLRALDWLCDRAADLRWDQLDDEVLLEVAAAENYTVYTANRADFARIAKKWADDGRAHAGIILRSPQIATPEAQIRALLALDVMDPGDWTDRVHWVKAS